MKNILLIVLLASGMSAVAQDTHYWSQPFGTRAALMSGAVVGGSNDNSMIFYNPGALGFMEESNISINANLYELANITVEDALGAQADFKSSQIGAIPLLISGMLSGDQRKWKIGYALISPVNFSFKGNVRVDGFFDLADNDESPGEEEFIADLSLDVKTMETMGGVAFSRKLNDKISLGFTHFFILRNQTYNNNTLYYGFLNDAENTRVSTTSIENMHYFNVRYQLKLGAAWRINNEWSMGLTVSTPSINLFGNGTVAANIAAENISISGSPRLDVLASDRQDKLKTKFKSPLSISLGANYNTEKSKFGVSMAYFMQLDDYAVMQAEPASFLRPADSFNEITSDQFLNVYAGAEGVFNIAIGYEMLLNENLSLVASFRNNMTYYREVDKPGIKPEVANWDIWHFVAGANIMKERSTLTVGLMPSIGNNKRFEQSGNLESEDGLLGQATTVTRANYFAIGFLLGYTYHFKKF